MKRLTYNKGISKGVVGFDEDFCYEICNEFSSNCDLCPVQKVILKLIDYEDTKLQPEGVEKLKLIVKDLRKENKKLKAEITEMLKYAWYKDGGEVKE